MQLAISTIAACLGLHLADPPPAALPKPPRPVVLDKTVEEVLAERIARAIIAASPTADPADAGARDAAAERLAACDDLLQAAEGRILWGGFNADQGYDPAAYRVDPIAPPELSRLTEFKPVVFAKLYLSTFTFPGPFTIRKEGHFTVLEIAARFRSGLDAGEYPYPFWHAPNKWTAYVNAESVLFIFEQGRLVAAMRKSPPPLALNLIKRPWDARWTWTDDRGRSQPRVTLFEYLFRKDNPHVPALDKAYRALEAEFRASNCISCHAPDNQSHMNELLLLNYPNQALIMRRNLVMVLEENRMPPGDFTADEPTGITDEAARETMLRLAREFSRLADAAFAFEQSGAIPAPAPASAPQSDQPRRTPN